MFVGVRRVSFLLSVVMTGTIVPAQRVTALTRTEVIQNCVPYLTTQISVTINNVYPHNACYTATNKEKLGIGNYTGIVYSWGNRDAAALVPTYLSNHLGAGNGTGLDLSCVRENIAGDDCTGFVGHAWGMGELNDLIYSSFKNAACSQRLSGYDALLLGDVLISDTIKHVAMFKNWTDASKATMRLTHADATAGICRDVTRSVSNYRDTNGFAPYVKNDLKDQPTATIVRFEIDPIPTGMRARWTTLTEKDTWRFVVYRAPDARGPFVPVSGEIEARGTAASGAEYEYVDVPPSETRLYYRLLECERNGRLIWHAVGSTTDHSEGTKLWPQEDSVEQGKGERP